MRRNFKEWLIKFRKFIVFTFGIFFITNLISFSEFAEFDLWDAAKIAILISGLIVLIFTSIMLFLRPVLKEKFRKNKYLRVYLFFILLILSCILSIIVEHNLYKNPELTIASIVGVLTGLVIYITVILVLAFTMKKVK